MASVTQNDAFIKTLLKPELSKVGRSDGCNFWDKNTYMKQVKNVMIINKMLEYFGQMLTYGLGSAAASYFYPKYLMLFKGIESGKGSQKGSLEKEKPKRNRTGVFLKMQ